MNNREFLCALCTHPGASGWEEQASRLVLEQFRRRADDVWVDPFYNTYARMGTGPRPRVLVTAHVDQIALMVTLIHEDGFLSFTQVGGVDQRVLPGKEVIVHGVEPMLGVIGCRPPHVQVGEDQSKSIPMADLTIDIGYPPEQVQKRVKVGDIATFNYPAINMGEGSVTGTALDDRAGVVAMCEAMDRLAGVNLYPEVVFAATTREELGCLGAKTAAFGGGFDMAVVLDVTHGETPDAPKLWTLPMDRNNILLGCYVSKPLTQRLRDVAAREHIELSLSVSPQGTGTDADTVQVSEEGIPVAVLSFPLRYMHTPVELLRYNLLEEAGRLLAAFLRSIDDRWEGWLCF